MLDEARQLLAMGYQPIPLRQGGKKPLVPWKEFQTRKVTEAKIAEWFSEARNNIGIVCGPISGDLFVKDFDDLQKAREAFNTFRERIRTIVLTPRGAHFWFRKSDGRNSQGDKEDERGKGGYVAVPPSLVSNTQYRFVEGFGLVPPEQLCELPEEMVSKPMIGKVIDNSIRDVRRYISKIQAVAGQGGHDSTFRAACVLRDAGLSEAEVLEELIGWNETNASPAWSLKELTHKAKSAFERKAK